MNTAINTATLADFINFLQKNKAKQFGIDNAHCPLGTFFKLENQNCSFWGWYFDGTLYGYAFPAWAQRFARALRTFQRTYDRTGVTGAEALDLARSVNDNG